MTKRPSGAMGILGDQSPLTGSSVRANEWELSLPKFHHQAESDALSIPDPGPAGFDFVLPDQDPAAEALWALARDFMWRRALMKDG
ncbi:MULTISPECIES: hypothetical protein [unclassified Bradyrhizobium]|uniref:hypothetical protein n=1 Tax=unclassified Bradyrhizobium TaxID=2631580 RepID=UPI001BA6DD00|nr:MULTISPECIES: hypothetical protein [unclassified Bradyrhizobium]MBR1229735.1 hypothetical protein [Bradyrhizobium sp. AUGA SZCCT0176]MBR1233956.1 hypothetical protein [Bradyrhizobium sp. AUGA SZCCT0182]MBR1286860.1 hypothetical protein [Bradyrhizobium sp. AUGA SZCCT0177]MBR1302349.1 hypothetical protein [Bradyrhizobium sp. AUGA SZCCT0042]